MRPFLVMCLGVLVIVHLVVERPRSPRRDRDEIESLIAQLQDRDPQVRWEAKLVLFDIGEPVVPYLIKILDSDKPEGQFEAVAALARFNYTKRLEAIPGLIRLLEKGDEQTQSAAVQTLRTMGPPALQAVPGL